MPLDEFVVASTELGNYAEQLLIGQCLGDKGYKWDVPWQNTDFKSAANFNEAGIKIFNVETAQQWGYHLGPPADQASYDKWAEFSQFANTYNPDPAFEGEFMACLQSVRDPNTLRDADQLDYIMSLKVQAADVAGVEPAVREASKEWRECLSGKFNFEVPGIPQEMPPSPLREAMAASPTASAEEVAIAVADAECQQTSGFLSARYDAEWDAEAALVDSNRAKLDRIRDEALAHRETLLTVVAENAPKP